MNLEQLLGNYTKAKNYESCFQLAYYYFHEEKKYSPTMKYIEEALSFNKESDEANFIKYLCQYKSSLDEVVKQNARIMLEGLLKNKPELGDGYYLSDPFRT